MNTEAPIDLNKVLSNTTDVDALLDELMTAYGQDVWNFAYGMTQSRDLADDIAQDVFLKVYRNLCTYRHEASIRTWLLTITRNTVLDYKRSAYFRRITLVDHFLGEPGGASAEEEVVAAEAIGEMWKLVMRLSNKYRETIILFAHYQLSMKEIANMLKVSEGTVKSRLHHARVKLASLKERMRDDQR